jgi:hypothetical protein
MRVIYSTGTGISFKKLSFSVSLSALQWRGSQESKRGSLQVWEKVNNNRCLENYPGTGIYLKFRKYRYRNTVITIPYGVQGHGFFTDLSHPILA